MTSFFLRKYTDTMTKTLFIFLSIKKVLIVIKCFKKLIVF